MRFVCTWITLEVTNVCPIFTLALLNYECRPGLNTQNCEGMQRACTGAHLLRAQFNKYRQGLDFLIMAQA